MFNNQQHTGRKTLLKYDNEWNRREMVNFKNNSEVKILSLPAYLALGHEVFNFLNKKRN